MSKVDHVQPRYLENASKMRELNIPGYKEQTEFNMLKVLDTYKRSVDYYNSYGLPSKSSVGKHSMRTSSSRPIP
jgi:hypothetical protein